MKWMVMVVLPGLWRKIHFLDQKFEKMSRKNEPKKRAGIVDPKITKNDQNDLLFGHPHSQE
jgi:hypothetical protein